MTGPTRSQARACMMRSRPRPAARRRSARRGRVAKELEPGESPGVDESLVLRSRLPLPGAAGGAQPAGLDDLALDGKTPPFAQPAQAPHYFVVADLLGGATVLADHELALMRMLDVAAGDKGVGGLDLMNELVGEQKIERAIDRRRPELAALLLELREQCIGSRRLVGSQDQLEHMLSKRRQPRTAKCADPLCPSEREFDLLRCHAWPPADMAERCYSVTDGPQPASPLPTPSPRLAKRVGVRGLLAGLA